MGYFPAAPESPAMVKVRVRGRIVYRPGTAQCTDSPRLKPNPNLKPDPVLYHTQSLCAASSPGTVLAILNMTPTMIVSLHLNLNGSLTLSLGHALDLRSHPTPIETLSFRANLHKHH